MTAITNGYEKAVKWHYRLKNIILHFCRSYKFITAVQIGIRVFKFQSAFNEFLDFLLIVVILFREFRLICRC